MKTKRKLPGIKALREKTLEINRTYTHSDLTTEKTSSGCAQRGYGGVAFSYPWERRDIYAITQAFF